VPEDKEFWHWKKLLNLSQVIWVYQGYHAAPGFFNLARKQGL
jgi:hypothetical protein